MTNLSETQETKATASGAALRIVGVTKSFPGVRALSDASFDCRPGEVHALVGENGSGKSTMIKVASGVLDVDAGEVFIGSHALDGAGVRRARQLGLMTAYQDTSLVNELSVADNISLSFNASGEPLPVDLAARLAMFDLPFRQSDLVGALGPGARQLLEVARSMAHRPSVLMLDEPTAALDLGLAAKLEEIVKRARDEGTAIVYVSHRLAEIRRLADRLTVIRDGVIRGTFEHQHWEIEDIVELMVGAPTEVEFPTRLRPASDQNRLEIHGLAGHQFGPVSINVRGGEIVGVAGAEGNGQRGLLRGIIGLEVTGGSTVVDGKRRAKLTPASALKVGLTFQSGDRSRESVFAPISVMQNATNQLGSEAGPGGLSLGRRLTTGFGKAAESLRIVAASPHQPISGLSGGNQQKAVLARAALRTPKVLIVDEPTQGVDVRARMDIYRVLADAADDGVAVLMNSSDSAELAGLCDRVYVMSRGLVVKELTGPTTENEIVRSFVSATDVVDNGLEHAVGLGFLRRLLARTSSFVPIAVLAMLIAAVALYTGSRTPVFWTSFNLSNLLLLTIPLGFVALGQQFAMVSGLFDISVGSAMSLGVVIVSMTLHDFTARSVLITLALLAVAAIGVGAFNSFLVVGLDVIPVVATVATLGVVRGIAIVLRPKVAGVISADFVKLVPKGIGWVPFTFIALLLLALSMEFWLYRSKRGLALRAVGFNNESSRRVGERVPRTRTISLLVCALGAVIGGLFLASLTGMGSNSAGASYTLPCFTAVFLGGAVLTGGRGSFVGALLGALFISLIQNATPLLHVQAAWQQTLYGGILILTIAVYAGLDRVNQRKVR